MTNLKLNKICIGSNPYYRILSEDESGEFLIGYARRVDDKWMIQLLIEISSYVYLEIFYKLGDELAILKRNNFN